MMYSKPLWLFVVLGYVSKLANGHGLMIDPAPRTGTTNAGNAKGGGRGPCGANDLQTKGTPTATYQAGDQVIVRWQSDIPHGGVCKISISNENDVGQPTADGSGILSGTSSVALTDLFTCCTSQGTEQTTVTIPNDFTCTNCVMQWYWDGDSDYFNCADITVTARGDPCESENCNNHGNCDSETGACECTGGYKGAQCTEVPTAEEAAEWERLQREERERLAYGCLSYDQGCGNGKCINDECVCNDGYWGYGCKLKTEGDKIRFTMEVLLESSEFDEEAFNHALGNFSTQLTTRDWDDISYTSTGGSSSSDGGAIAGAVFGTMLCMGAIIGGTWWYKNRGPGAGPVSRTSRPKTKGGANQSEMI